jgi:WD40 repeat protein
VYCTGFAHAQVWNAASGKPVTGLLIHNGLLSAKFSPDGTRVVTFGTEDDRVWDLASSKSVTPPLDHKHGQWTKSGSARFSPDGRSILTVNHTERFWLWNARTGQTQNPAVPSKEPLRDAAFGPEGKVIVTTSYQSATVWNPANGQHMNTITISPN